MKSIGVYVYDYEPIIAIRRIACSTTPERCRGEGFYLKYSRKARYR